MSPLQLALNVDKVDAEQARLTAAGLAPEDKRNSTGCDAKQDEFWVQRAPHGEM